MLFKIFKHKTMKKITRTLTAIICILFILFLAACGIDYTITTKINPDGSCERIMVARLDSSDLSENPFFISIDSTWEKSTKMEYDSAEKNTVALVTVKKKYSSVEEMNREFHQKNNISETQNLSMMLQKKFRWFYTKYRYEETYAQLFPFRHFPISDYFTEEEIKVFINEDPAADSIFFAGKDSVEHAQIENELEKKAETFIRDNTFEEFYSELLRTSRLSGSEFFKTVNLSEEKERMLEEFEPCFTILKDNCADTSAYLMLKKLDKLYQTNAFTSLIRTEPQAFKVFDQKLNIDFFAPADEDYEHIVLLPGTLLSTNAQKIIEGKAQWKFDLSYYVYCDFTMWAESKRANTWAYLITIIVIVASLAMGIVRIISRQAGISQTGF